MPVVVDRNRAYFCRMQPVSRRTSCRFRLALCGAVVAARISARSSFEAIECRTLSQSCRPEAPSGWRSSGKPGAVHRPRLHQPTRKNPKRVISQGAPPLISYLTFFLAQSAKPGRPRLLLDLRPRFTRPCRPHDLRPRPSGYSPALSGDRRTREILGRSRPGPSAPLAGDTYLRAGPQRAIEELRRGLFGFVGFHRILRSKSAGWIQRS